MNRVQIAVLGLTFLAFAGAYLLFANGGNPPAPVQQIIAKADTEPVMVVAADLPMGHKIAPTDFRWVEWPNAAVSQAMILKSDPKAVDDVVGAVTRYAFLQGEPMRRDKIIKGLNAGFLSAILPAGMRAVAIDIDASGANSAGGFILPNDRVDVIQVVRDDDASGARGADVFTTRTILSNVRVLAIGQNIQDKDGQQVVTGGNATLELNPEQSEEIILAQKTTNGHLHLTLRSLLDASGTTDSNLNDSGNALTIVRYGAAQQAIR
jgi:pilus assembly protein CpaB